MGLNVPVVLARNPPHGLLLLSDLGNRPYLDDLAAGRDVDRLYADAIGRAGRNADPRPRGPGGALPPYDRALLLREMEFMPEWFLSRHLGIAAGARTRDARAAVRCAGAIGARRSRRRSCIGITIREICW